MDQISAVYEPMLAIGWVGTRPDDHELTWEVGAVVPEPWMDIVVNRPLRCGISVRLERRDDRPVPRPDRMVRTDQFETQGQPRRRPPSRRRSRHTLTGREYGPTIRCAVPNADLAGGENGTSAVDPHVR